MFLVLEAVAISLALLPPASDDVDFP